MPPPARRPATGAVDPDARWRLFVAVDVGDEVRAEVTRVRAELDAALQGVPAPPRIAWVAPSNLHITLRFLGERPAGQMAALREALAYPVAIAPFTVEWRGLGAFPGPRNPRALWMGVTAGAAALAELEREISRRLDGAGYVESEAHPFRPHVTIGRIKVPGAGIDWMDLLETCHVRGARSGVEYAALYRSELTPQGPHYTEVIKVPLLAP